MTTPRKSSFISANEFETIYVEFKITVFDVCFFFFWNSNHVKFTDFLPDSQFVQFISETTDVYVGNSQTVWRMIKAGKEVS